MRSEESVSAGGGTAGKGWEGWDDLEKMDEEEEEEEEGCMKGSLKSSVTQYFEI